jgi:hypothetical protein
MLPGNKRGGGRGSGQGGEIAQKMYVHMDKGTNFKKGKKSNEAINHDKKYL